MCRGRSLPRSCTTGAEFFSIPASRCPNEQGSALYRLYAETKKALASEDVKQRLAQASLAPVGNTPKEFDVLIRADVERWTALAKSLSLEPQ